MFSALLNFVQDNVLLTLVIILGILLSVALLKAVVRILIVALLITGFIYVYNTYTPDVENAGIALLKSSQGTATEEGLRLLVSNSDNLIVSEDKGATVLKTSGVELSWVEGSDKARLNVRGNSTEFPMTDAVKMFIKSVDNK